MYRHQPQQLGQAPPPPPHTLTDMSRHSWDDLLKRHISVIVAQAGSPKARGGGCGGSTPGPGFNLLTSITVGLNVGASCTHPIDLLAAFCHTGSHRFGHVVLNSTILVSHQATRCLDRRSYDAIPAGVSRSDVACSVRHAVRGHAGPLPLCPCNIHRRATVFM